MSDEKVFIKALQQKDEKAFVSLVDQFQPMVNRIIFKITNDMDDTHDLTQEVFISIWQQINRFRADSSLSTWIYQLSVNKALNHLKQKKRRSFFRLSSVEGHAKEPSGLQHSHNLAATTMNQRDDENAIAKALKQLPENQRIAFILSKSEGLSNPEIADILSLSVSAVESLHFRARQNLAKTLQHYYQQKIS